MRRFAKENGLSLFFATIFLGALVGQSFAGQHNYNAEQVEHGQQALSWWHYVVTPDFGGAVLENWQSEFLQFSLFIAATIWLVQRGSNESKKPEDVGLEGDEQQMIGPHTPTDGPGWAKAEDIRSRISVRVETVGTALHACIVDDGIGGADVTAGTGLVGLIDRVEALGGRLTLESPVGGGTTIAVELPLGRQA